MRAVYAARYGTPEVLSLRELPAPEPGPGEVRIRVHATTVSRTDTATLRGHPWLARAATGIVRPKHPVLGMDFAGVVDAVGAGVTSPAPGDRVFGLSPSHYGAHADYLCLAADGPLAEIPAGLPFSEAVVCEGAWFASTYLDAFDLGPDHRILVYGASGSIGTAAVQLAKARGAHVTAVVATRHLQLVDSLGADRAVDYTAEDYTRLGATFDFVLDAVGKADYLDARKLLRPSGVFAATDFGPRHQNIPLALWSSITRSHRVIFPLPKNPHAVVRSLPPLLESGQLRGVIDRTYPLEQIADAYRYVETEQKTGIVVTRVAPEPDADAAA